jgi:hypothetical protein
MPADVFKEAEARLDLAHDPCDVGPEMPWVFVAELASGDGERLARIAAMDDIHQAAPRSAIEGANVVPDRRAIHGRVLHPRHERGRRIGFPLDVTHSSISGVGDVQAEVETSGSGAEGQSEQASPEPAVHRPCAIASGGR